MPPIMTTGCDIDGDLYNSPHLCFVSKSRSRATTTMSPSTNQETVSALTARVQARVQARESLLERARWLRELSLLCTLGERIDVGQERLVGCERLSPLPELTLVWVRSRLVHRLFDHDNDGRQRPASLLVCEGSP